MGRVLVTRKLPKGALDPLVAAGHAVVERAIDVPYTHDELANELAEVDAVVCVLTDTLDAR